MGVAQKTTFSIDSTANSKRGVSGALMEYIRSGIGSITILPIFGLKTTSFPWPIYLCYTLPIPYLYLTDTLLIFNVVH